MDIRIFVLLLATFVAFEGSEAVHEDCTLPPDPGFCMAYFPSYFFNITSKMCETFVYGGCQGNANRFHTQVDCEEKCALDCSDIPCEFGGTCDTTEDKPICTCNKYCPFIYDPLCGSDGVTYSNLCVLKSEECVQQKTIKYHQGPCD